MMTVIITFWPHAAMKQFKATTINTRVYAKVSAAEVKILILMTQALMVWYSFLFHRHLQHKQVTVLQNYQNSQYSNDEHQLALTQFFVQQGAERYGPHSTD